MILYNAIQSLQSVDKILKFYNLGIVYLSFRFPVFLLTLRVFIMIIFFFLTVYSSHFELENGVMTTPKRRFYRWFFLLFFLFLIEFFENMHSCYVYGKGIFKSYLKRLFDLIGGKLYIFNSLAYISFDRVILCLPFWTRP